MAQLWFWPGEFRIQDVFSATCRIKSCCTKVREPCDLRVRAKILRSREILAQPRNRVLIGMCAWAVSVQKIADSIVLSPWHFVDVFSLVLVFANLTHRETSNPKIT